MKKEIANFFLSRSAVWLSFKTGELARLDSRTGEVVMSKSLDDIVTQWHPLHSELLTCLSEKGLWCLDKGSLEKQWFYEPDGVISALTASPKEMFVVRDGTTLYAFDLSKAP